MTNKTAINGVIRDMTPEEETKYEEVKTQGLADSENQKKDREDFLSLKASGKAKLVAGEALTQEEADAIVL